MDSVAEETPFIARSKQRCSLSRLPPKIPPLQQWPAPYWVFSLHLQIHPQMSKSTLGPPPISFILQREPSSFALSSDGQGRGGEEEELRVVTAVWALLLDWTQSVHSIINKGLREEDGPCTGTSAQRCQRSSRATDTGPPVADGLVTGQAMVQPRAQSIPSL